MPPPLELDTDVVDECIEFSFGPSQDEIRCRFCGQTNPRKNLYQMRRHIRFSHKGECLGRGAATPKGLQLFKLGAPGVHSVPVEQNIVREPANKGTQTLKPEEEKFLILTRLRMERQFIAAVATEDLWDEVAGDFQQMFSHTKFTSSQLQQEYEKLFETYWSKQETGDTSWEHYTLFQRHLGTSRAASNIPDPVHEEESRPETPQASSRESSIDREFVDSVPPRPRRSAPVQRSTETRKRRGRPVTQSGRRSLFSDEMAEFVIRERLRIPGDFRSNNGAQMLHNVAVELERRFHGGLTARQVSEYFKHSLKMLAKAEAKVEEGNELTEREQFFFALFSKFSKAKHRNQSPSDNPARVFGFRELSSRGDTAPKKNRSKTSFGTRNMKGLFNRHLNVERNPFPTEETITMRGPPEFDEIRSGADHHSPSPIRSSVTSDLSETAQSRPSFRDTVKRPHIEPDERPSKFLLTSPSKSSVCSATGESSVSPFASPNQPSAKRESVAESTDSDQTKEAFESSYVEDSHLDFDEKAPVYIQNDVDQSVAAARMPVLNNEDQTVELAHVEIYDIDNGPLDVVEDHVMTESSTGVSGYNSDELDLVELTLRDSTLESSSTVQSESMDELDPVPSTSTAQEVVEDPFRSFVAGLRLPTCMELDEGSLRDLYETALINPGYNPQDSLDLITPEYLEELQRDVNLFVRNGL